MRHWFRWETGLNFGHGSLYIQVDVPFVKLVYIRLMKARKSKHYGPPKLYPVRTLVLLAQGVLEAVDRALSKDETRQDFIRAAIAAELKRRKR